MNLQSIFQEFNVSKFVVYSCLLVFSILFALRLDGTITISYWMVFMPLWIWKTLVVVGGVTGAIVWARNPDYRLSESSYISFKSMLISLSLQLLLLMFELLVCDKLESGRHLWTLAFIPLLFVSLLSVAITVWALKNERSFELELFCAVNVLQFLFVALRLDNLLTWSWVVVFVPFWVLITMALIGVLYALIFATILLRTPDIAADTRRASFHSAVSYSLVVLPLMIFLVLLSNKLDYSPNASHGISSHSLPPQHPFFLFPQGLFPTPVSSTHFTATSTPTPFSLPTSPQPTNAPPQAVAAQLSYFAISCPLYLAFLILICLSFGGRGGNTWWFGMRRDFCSFLLLACPCLREYGNISYTKQASRRNNNDSASEATPDMEIQRRGHFEDSFHYVTSRMNTMVTCQPKKHLSPSPPHFTIESPD